jgi:putative flippase GtrA
MFRYLLVGVLNTAFGYGIYALFIFFGLYFTVAALISQIVGMAFNYFSYGKIVFKTKFKVETLVKFAIFYGLLYLISITVLFLLQKAGLNAYVAGLGNMCVSVVLSFIINRSFVFNKPRV